MPKRSTQKAFHRRMVALLRFLGVAAGAVVTAAGAVYWLTLPEGSSRSRSRAWPERPVAAVQKTSTAVMTPAARPSQHQVPLFSEFWIDDSGYEFARTFAKALDDPTALATIKDSGTPRFELGLAEVTKQLEALDRTKEPGRSQAFRPLILKGLLQMAVGRFLDADRAFLEAQSAGRDAQVPLDILANLDALRGIAALRLGETENCVDCCNSSSCIFPLAPEAIHANRRGSTGAVGLFTLYLQKRPDDIGVRWLLNIAHMTLGTYPGGVPKDQLIPLEPFQKGGTIPRLDNVAPRVGLSDRGENMAGGCIVDDFNGDGWLDVFYSTIDTAQGCAFFLNGRNGKFENHSPDAHLEDQVGAENCIHADYDNDGDLDVLLLRGAWEFPLRPSLLRNDGTGTFDDQTEAAGLDAPIATESAAWSDFDLDGDLDLYIGGEFLPSKPDDRNRGKLYRNNGDGTFTDIAQSAGLWNEGFCRGTTWGDYDNDGRPDLFISNMGQANRLFHNNGDGTFTDLAGPAGVTEPIVSYGCWFWDYDNDGQLDLFVTGSRASVAEVIRSHLGLETTGERPRLYHNNGDGTFTDLAKISGLDRVWAPMGCNFGDIDNDGFLDFYLGTGAPPYSFLVPKVLMRNVHGQSFEDVTTSSGTGHLQKGHGIAFADYDRDGDTDLFLECGGAVPGDKAHNSLFKNPGTPDNHRITLKLIGTKSNRSGLGARIRIDVKGKNGPRSIYRDITPGATFGNNPLTPTIGVGPAEGTANLEIRWLGGEARQAVNNLPLDGSFEITEGQEGFRKLW